MVAVHLANYDWQEGDLTRLMLLMWHESGYTADPYENERNHGTGPRSVAGLCSHRREFWESRTLNYLGYVGQFYQPDQHDDIHLCVALFKVEGPGHWAGAGWDVIQPRLREVGL